MPSDMFTLYVVAWPCECLCLVKFYVLLSLPWHFAYKKMMQWCPAPPPPPPTQCYLGYAYYACSLFLKAPPIWGLPTFPNPPFTGFLRAFPALETPLNHEKCSMYPLKFRIISQESKEMREKKKKHPLFKEISGWKVNTPLFLQFSGRTLSHEKYPFTGHFGNTHGVCPFSEWGGRAMMLT